MRNGRRSSWGWGLRGQKWWVDMTACNRGAAGLTSSIFTHPERAQTPNIELVHGDILRVGIPGILAQMQKQHEAKQRAAAGAADDPDFGPPEASTSGRGGAAAGSWRQRQGAGGAAAGSLKVVANLPYNITKDFLKATLPLGGVVSELSIMIQHEVAERLVDPTPSRPDYRAMSIYTHYYSSPKYRLRIPRTKYFPVPGVDGALVTFRLAAPEKRPAVPSERGFHALVAKAFSERRKMMRNSMQPLFSSQQVGGGRLGRLGARGFALGGRTCRGRSTLRVLTNPEIPTCR
jgi:16S rRNA (adenine1518-N6/adenine1519-N6)-dimethyltransferase